MTSRLSIVVPFQAEGALLDRCLSSTAPLVEAGAQLVLASNEADSKTLQRAQSWQQRIGASLLYLPRQSVGQARNAALDSCTGDYVAFVDADDEVSAVPLASLVDRCDRAGADVGRGSVVLSDALNIGASRPSTQVRLVRHSNPWSAFLAWPALHGVIYRRRFLVVNDVRFPDSAIAEDIAFNMQVLRYSPRAVTCEDATYTYTFNRDGQASGRRYSPRDVMDSMDSVRPCASDTEAYRVVFWRMILTVGIGATRRNPSRWLPFAAFSLISRYWDHNAPRNLWDATLQIIGDDWRILPKLVRLAVAGDRRQARIG